MNEHPNTNVLEGFRCPNPDCGSYGPFKIEVKQYVVVHDDGTDLPEGDTEWDDENYCQCCECDHEATVKAFNEEGEAS
jgi:hypothetical protein